jgi:lipoprotein NlpD
MALARIPRDGIGATASGLLPAAAMILLLASCASRQPAPVEDRTPRPPPQIVAAPPVETPAAGVEPAAPTYTVKRGDTLRQIAAERGLDYRELAAWNNIENMNVLRVGQVLRLTSPNAPAANVAGVQTAPLREPGVPVPQAPVAPVATMAPPSTTAPAAPAIVAVPAPGFRNSETYKTQPKAI